MREMTPGSFGFRTVLYAVTALLVPAAGLSNARILTAQQPTTVILVRHAEKVDDPGNRDPELSAAGNERASQLASMLRDAGVTRIYSTPFRRTRNTAAPLADAIGVPIEETPISATYATDVAERIMTDNRGETVLVVGHSNSTPSVVNALAGTRYGQFDESDYTNLFVVTIGADGASTVLQLRY